jgi:hypothetical protein
MSPLGQPEFRAQGARSFAVTPSRAHRRLALGLASAALAGLFVAPTEVASKDPHAFDSGVRGVITISGRCAGLPSDGPPTQGCQPKPFKATVKVLKECNRHEVLRFTSRKRDGHYRARLKPGRYILHPTEKHGGFYHAELHIHVRKHKFVHRNIRYENGEA